MVRATLVQMNSQGRRTEVKRPIQRLYHIEVPVCEESHVDCPVGPAIAFVPDDDVEVVQCVNQEGFNKNQNTIE